MKILMTCFEAFGGFTTNSTELALSKLNYLDIDSYIAIIITDYIAWWQLYATIKLKMLNIYIK